MIRNNQLTQRQTIKWPEKPEFDCSGRSLWCCEINDNIQHFSFSFEEDTYNPGLDAAISFSHLKVDLKQPANASTKLSKETLESRGHFVSIFIDSNFWLSGSSNFHHFFISHWSGSYKRKAGVFQAVVDVSQAKREQFSKMDQYFSMCFLVFVFFFSLCPPPNSSH